MVRIFTHQYLKNSLGELQTKALVDDFRAYKEGKGLPTTFGRDVPYRFTHNRSYLELQHLQRGSRSDWYSSNVPVAMCWCIVPASSTATVIY